MRKIICITIVLVLTFILSSCVSVNESMNFTDKDSYLTNSRMNQIFEALEKKDENMLKSVFSNKAVSESKTLDNDIEQMLSFIEGNVVSCEYEYPVVFDTVEYGQVQKQLLSWYYLRTDKETYFIFVADFPIDMINPDNVGVYSIRVLKSQDENKLEGYMEDWIIPGIYILK